MEKRSQLCPSSPSLVFPHGRKERSQTFFTLSDGNYCVRSIHDMRGRHCYACYQGWLFMKSNYSGECFLWNPISRAKILLPPLELQSYWSCVLTASPSDSNCAVVILYEIRRHLYCMFCWPSDGKWIQQDLEPEKKVDDEYNAGFAAICFQGKVYLRVGGGRIGILDVHRTIATVNFVEEEKPIHTWNIMRLQRYLVESCGDIFLVVKGYIRVHDVVQTFEVFKLNTSEKMRWEKVTSLGDRIFLVSTDYSLSVSATDLGIQGNCIYFCNHKDRSLYKFNMESESISVTLPCPNVVRQWESPYWFVPTV